MALKANIQDVPENFGLDWLKEGNISLKSRQQGFKYLAEGYLHQIEMIWREKVIVISARCYPSQRKNQAPHLINLDIDTEGNMISDVMCSCQAGKIRVDTNSLNILINSGFSIGHLVSKPPLNSHTFLGSVTVASGLATHDVGAASCGDLTFPKLTDMTVREEFKSLVAEMSLQSCLKIEEATRKQAESPQWFKEREGRLTASHFKEIIRRKKVTLEFIRRVLNHTSTINSAATNYGKTSERLDIQKYIETTGHHVHEAGLNVSPSFSFLGATPDGKVCIDGTTGIIEIKCPYSARDLTIEEATTLLKDFFLFKSGDDYHLKEDHAYFYQVQGQLMISGAPFCMFMIYTRKDLKTLKILKNITFMQDMLNSLCSFYKSHCMAWQL